MKVLITGLPGCGKTTLCKKIIQALTDKKICGILSEEIREGGERKGFKIIDIKTGAEGMLAHVAQKEGPRVGGYRVHLSDVEKFSGAIQDDCNLIIIDEIGPMELHSEKFIRAVKAAFESGRSVIATIHYKSNHQLVEELKRSYKLYEINGANRDRILKELLNIYAKKAERTYGKEMTVKINVPKDPANLTDGEKKHLPVIHAPETAKMGASFEVTVRVGELLAHPNESGHYIQWIELYAEDKLLCKTTLTPISSEPNVTFRVKLHESKTLRAVESCNLHGLWEGAKKVEIR